MADFHFEQVVSRGCGMDIHKKVVVATVLGEGFPKETRTYGTFTSSLTQMRDWLVSLGITHVAMESTGIYWKPIYNVFDDHIRNIWIVNARHIKNVTGLKTDKNDSEWLCQLLMAGWFKPSFIPPPRQLRDLTRYRRKLIGMVSANKNRINRPLEDGNVKLSTGRITELDSHIKEILSPYHKAIERLNEIPGVQNRTCEELIAEIGLDIGNFPTPVHLYSWAGICPGNNESAGKKKSVRTSHGDKHIRASLVEAAWATSRTKGTFFMERFSRLAVRKGTKKALITVGHSLLTCIYYVLATGGSYKELGDSYTYSQRKRNNARTTSKASLRSSETMLS